MWERGKDGHYISSVLFLNIKKELNCVRNDTAQPFLLWLNCMI